MSALDALAVLLILAIFCAGMIATFTRKPRHDASAERANADRRSLSGGAAKPLHALSDNGKVQHDHGA